MFRCATQWTVFVGSLLGVFPLMLLDVVPRIRRQQGPTASLRPGLQPWELPSTAGPAARNQALDPDNDSGEIDQDRGKGVRHARRVAFQLAEVAVPRRLFLAILCAINRLRLPMPAPG